VSAPGIGGTRAGGPAGRGGGEGPGGDGPGGDGVPGPDARADAPYAAALAGLPGAGPATLIGLMREWSPEEAWRRVKDGRLARPTRRQFGRGQFGRGQLGLDLTPPATGVEPGTGTDEVRHALGATDAEDVCLDRSGQIDRSWQEAARRIDPPGWWARYEGRGVGVTWLGDPYYPAALVDDPDPPGVLFWRGSLRHLDRPCVAIVGTRRATPDGRAVAFELGRDLAQAGICVVSGLALGIDGAAHAGALTVRSEATGTADQAEGRATGAMTSPGPAGVAASGVDVPYPRRHARLWERVADEGVLLSETLPGRAAQAWRFPARNRIIAGLARMVVVVESHQGGGSLITAEAAIARGIELRVVPGPVHSSASAGSNQLLYDGPGPVRNARDVLDGLGIFLSGTGSPSAPAAARQTPTEDELDADACRVLDAVLWRPTSFNQVVERSQISVVATARRLDSLEALGFVGRDGGWWVRRPQRS
jgi:DNA processing protein